MLNKIYSLISITTLCLITQLAFSANVYKWTDAEGNTHYGDRPTESSEKISVKSQRKLDKNHQQRQEETERVLDVLETDRKQKASDKEKVAEQKKKREQRCVEAKQNLKDYQEAGYLYKLDENGEREVLEGEAYENALNSARDAVKDWCK